MTKAEKIEAVIKDAFADSSYGASGIVISSDESWATFSAYPDDVTFDRLEKIAIGLNTKAINIENFDSGGGGCDTCGYGGTSKSVELYVKNIPDPA